MLIELVKRGELNLRTVVNKTSHAVADRFGIADRGYIREGYFADLVLVDPHGTTTVKKEDLLYKCGWSPVTGRTFPAKVLATWVNGGLAYRDGVVSEKPLGERINFIRNRSEEHTSELQSLMRISYAVFCLQKKKQIS